LVFFLEARSHCVAQVASNPPTSASPRAGITRVLHLLVFQQI
jgi:hypothetical protein